MGSKQLELKTVVFSLRPFDKSHKSQERIQKWPINLSIHFAKLVQI